MSSNIISGYITNVHPMLINDSIIWDIYCLRENSTKLFCIRVFNIQLSFMVARLPGLNIDQFTRFIKTFTGDLHIEVRTDLADSSYFNFGNNREYIEIFSPSPKVLSNVYTKMNKSFKSYYSRIHENELTPNDALFYRNTETPFRFTSTTTNLTQTVYNLSTKYNIPLVGGIKIDLSRLVKKSYPSDYLPEFDMSMILGLDAQIKNAWNYESVNGNINLAIKRDETIDLKSNMTMFAYDIETYNPDGNLDPTIDDYYIFCIGVGIFDLNNNTPHERYCLIFKDFDGKPINPDTNMELKYKISRKYGRKSVIVSNEYQHYVSNDGGVNDDVIDIGAEDDVDDVGDLLLGGMKSKNINSEHINDLLKDECKNKNNNGINDMLISDGDENIDENINEQNMNESSNNLSSNDVNINDININNLNINDANINNKHLNIKQNVRDTSISSLTNINNNINTSHISSKQIHTIPDNEYQPKYPDQTTYIICKDEKDLLICFNQLLSDYQPQIITGFNSFGFDDNYMYTRMVKYDLDQQYLQCFTYYDISTESTLVFQNWFKPFIPQFKQFDLKIDNEQRHDNKSVKAWLVLNIDVYKLMLKEDPKRFTQYGRGNLDTMLEVYDIHNPFNKQPLSKTGLKIHEMYRRWINNENIYSIALYCCQDSWITGTLLISRAKLSDLIEMAGISHTMFADSIYRADGVRVANCILSYAYDEKFALMDNPYHLRKDLKKDPSLPRLGGKTYDHRTIVGGQVRNIHAGRQWFVVALDYSAMYPSQKEASNIDSSSRIDDDVIKNPDKYGIDIVRKLNINDMYGKREIFYVKNIKRENDDKYIDDDTSIDENINDNNFIESNEDKCKNKVSINDMLNE